MKSSLNNIIVITLTIMSIALNTNAQEGQPPSTEFPIGAFMGRDTRINTTAYSAFENAGLNTMVQYADESTKELLSDLKVIALNADSEFDYIHHYATGYYTRWEAEQNQTNDTLVGIKHRHGQFTEWRGIPSWSTIGINSPVDSVVFGPHYRQEKRYKRWLYGDRYDVKYTARYHMALDYDSALVGQDENVCVIKVVHRYAEVYHTPPENLDSYDSLKIFDQVLREDTIKVNRFNSDGNFVYIYFEETDTNFYSYDHKFIPRSFENRLAVPVNVDTTYTDSNGDNGIQFWVEWLRDDTLCTLYIDHIEVYDNFGWNDMVVDSGIAQQTIQNIKDYAQSYSNWNNINYWYAHDEPYTIDAFTPMRVVDALVRSVGGAPLITEFHPDWQLVNHEPFLQRYYEMVQPHTLMIDYYPVTPTSTMEESLEAIRVQFTEAHSLHPGFWYVAQGFGFRLPGNNWCIWKKPDSTQLKAMTMLALSHGIKGLMFWNFDSQFDASDYCGSYYIDCIVDESYVPTDLWHVIKDNLAPRLKGKLGKALITLNYTGSYLNFAAGGTEGILHHKEYLSVWQGNQHVSYHAGFLESKADPENRFYLILNKLVGSDQARNCQMYINYNQTLSGFTNWRVRNAEAGFDTTFSVSNHLAFSDTLMPGEGKLYQVAPVIKYGGRLIYPEQTTHGMSLYDETK